MKTCLELTKRVLIIIFFSRIDRMQQKITTQYSGHYYFFIEIAFVVARTKQNKKFAPL